MTSKCLLHQMNLHNCGICDLWLDWNCGTLFISYIWNGFGRKVPVKKVAPWSHYKMCMKWWTIAHSFTVSDCIKFILALQAAAVHSCRVLWAVHFLSLHVILAKFHGIFYCYSIPRYIVTLAILVLSRKYDDKYRGVLGIAQYYLDAWSVVGSAELHAGLH